MTALGDARRLLTDHAVARYRRRIDSTATRRDVQAVLNEGRLRSSPPLDVAVPAGHVVGYVVNGEAVFAMRQGAPGAPLVAVTTVRRRLRSKADRRAYREEQRDQNLAA